MSGVPDQLRVHVTFQLRVRGPSISVDIPANYDGKEEQMTNYDSIYEVLELS